MQRSLKPTRIDRRLAGQPIKLGERTVQPVARVTGWSGSAGRRRGAWLHTRPVEVLVTDDDGHTYRVPIEVRRDATAVRWLALAGVLMLPLNWFLRRRKRRRLS